MRVAHAKHAKPSVERAAILQCNDAIVNRYPQESAMNVSHASKTFAPRTADVVWPLGAADMLTLKLQPGERVRCERGTVWLTVDGELDDIVLEAGEVHVVQRAQTLRASGLDCGRLVVLGQGAAQRPGFSARAALAA
jgi:hypothetical protein